MMAKKIPRLSGIRERVIYRDSHGRFATRENSLREEYWKYRVDEKGRPVDIKIEALPYSYYETQWFPSIQLPETGARSGRISSILKKPLRDIPVSRQDVRIEIRMTARTYHGKKVKRKLVFHHYNSKKIEQHTVGGIINELFYKHGDRPSYDPKKITGWRKRETTKKETMKRRQLHDVTFHIMSVNETREKKTRKRRKKK